jgi:hypothetical protein
MKGPVPVESASALIDEKIKELGDWRGKTLAKVRELVHEADPEILEEWAGGPPFSLTKVRVADPLRFVAKAGHSRRRFLWVLISHRNHQLRPSV